MPLFLFSFMFFPNSQIALNELSVLLFYFNCMYKSIKSSCKASFCVERAFAQNVLLCTFINMAKTSVA